jgi:hypothetical protein
LLDFFGLYDNVLLEVRIMITPIKEKIVEEIKKFPDEKVRKLYDIIISLRDEMGVENEDKKREIPLGTMFAGKWQDERSAEEIIKEIKENRYSREKDILL